MAEIDSIEIRPDTFGWKLIIRRVIPEIVVEETYEISDAIQFHAEVDRTIGRWLADGPADFHNARADSTEPVTIRVVDTTTGEDVTGEYVAGPAFPPDKEDTDHGR